MDSPYHKCQNVASLHNSPGSVLCNLEAFSDSNKICLSRFLYHCCICVCVSEGRWACTKAQVWRSQNHLQSQFSPSRYWAWASRFAKANVLISKMSYWLQLRLLRIFNCTKVSHKEGNKLSMLTGSKHIASFSYLNITITSIHTPDILPIFDTRA